MDKAEFAKDFGEFFVEVKKEGVKAMIKDIALLYAIYRKDLRSERINSNGHNRNKFEKECYGVDDIRKPDNPGKEPATERQKHYCQRLAELGERITLIAQTEQSGFGHAVFCARDWVGDEPFLLMLGDHLYTSDTEEPCAHQLLNAFEANGRKSIVGVYQADVADVCHYGTVAGTWTGDGQRVLQVSELAEKPSVDYARSSLVTPDLPPDTFLCIYGQYVLTPTVFQHLVLEIEADMREGGEIQLTTALESLRRDEGVLGYRIEGQHYDTGLPGPYVRTLAAIYRGGGPGADAEQGAP